MIVVLWRAGLRIHEALGLAETDREERRTAMLVHGRGRSGAEGGMHDWAGSSCGPGCLIKPQCRSGCSSV